MKADPEGLAALAAGLAAAAAELSSVTAGDVVHPPLASDTVSVAAAQRLTAGAEVLMGNVGAHGSDLADLAARLSEIATMFTVQEACNEQALRSLARPATAAAQRSMPPLVRPPVLPDVRPPLVAVPPPGGEVFAGQVHAGSSEVGEGFGASVAAAAATLRGVAGQVRQGAEWLPEVWRSTVPGAELAKVFTTRADTFDQFAEAADGLNAQRGAHARAFTQAQQATPTPQQFAQNRQQLAAAQLNNARTGGRFAAQVAQLTGERTRLEASALGAHSTYSQASAPATDPGPDAGTLNESQTQGGGGPTPGSSGPGPTPGDQDSANLDGDPGAGLNSAGLDDPMMGRSSGGHSGSGGRRRRAGGWPGPAADQRASAAAVGGKQCSTRPYPRPGCAQDEATQASQTCPRRWIRRACQLAMAQQRPGWCRGPRPSRRERRWADVVAAARATTRRGRIATDDGHRRLTRDGRWRNGADDASHGRGSRPVTGREQIQARATQTRPATTAEYRAGQR